MHSSSQLTSSQISEEELQKENLILKMRLIQTESQVNSDISSIAESNFAEEISNTIKSRDIILEKAKISILQLEAEIQSLQNSNVELTDKLELRDADIQQKQQKMDQLIQQAQTQYQELISHEENSISLKNQLESLQNEVNEKAFLIEDLQQRFCSLDQTSKDFTTEFEEHLKSVDAGYQEEMAKLRKEFADQINGVYRESNAEIDKLRAAKNSIEDELLKVKNECQSAQALVQQREQQFKEQEATINAAQQLAEQQKQELKQCDDCKLELHKLELQLQTEQELTEELKKKISSLIEENGSLGSALERAREKHSKLVLIIKEQQADSERVASIQEQAKVQAEQHGQQIEALMGQKQEAEAELNTLKSSYQALIGKNEVTDRALMQINTEFNTLQKNHLELEQYYEQLKEEYDLAVSTLEVARKDEDQTESLISELKAQNERLKTENEHFAEENSTLEERVAKFQQAVTNEANQLAELTNAKANDEKMLADESVTIEQLRGEATDMKSVLLDEEQKINYQKVDFEQVSAQFEELKIQFAQAREQQEVTERQLNEVLGEKSTADDIARVQSAESSANAQRIQELLAFKKQIYTSIQNLHQMVCIEHKSLVFSPKSSSIQETDVYELIGEVKTAFQVQIQQNNDNEVQIMKQKDQIMKLEAEMEDKDKENAYLLEENTEKTEKESEIMEQQEKQQVQATSLKERLEEAENIKEQALDQRQTLKKQKEEELERIDELTRKLASAKVQQDSLQEKLALDVKSIQDEFSGQIRNFYNKCMLLQNKDELRQEIQNLYSRIGM